MNVSVLGAGGWGTALGVAAARAGHGVKLWVRDEAKAFRIKKARQNREFLPGVKLERSMEVTASLEEALAGSEVVLVAIPSHGVRGVLERAVSFCPSRALLVSGVKGVEQGSWLRMSEVIQKVMGSRPVAVVSGPSHAEEVGKGLPTAVVVAARDRRVREQVTRAFKHPNFRLYHSEDVVGVECGGAFKNVMAIAAGMAQGLKVGDNAMAALYTRGLAEIARLGVAMGGQPLTFSGLAGLGDLIVTCHGPWSRNRFVGVELAKGRSLTHILAHMNMVAEGVRTTEAMLHLARRHRVRVPIVTQVGGVLFKGWSPQKALKNLLANQSSTDEFDF